MQPIDVLRDQRVQFAGGLDGRERAVSGVRLGAPRGMVEPLLARISRDNIDGFLITSRQFGSRSQA